MYQTLWDWIKTCRVEHLEIKTGREGTYTHSREQLTKYSAKRELVVLNIVEEWDESIEELEIENEIGFVGFE